MKSVIGLLAAGLCSCAIGEMSFRSGEGWQPFANAKDIEAGSALDFSGMGLVDAPAGKFGWLRAANGHAEFEGRPGVPVRFWGVNICSDANFLEPDEIERLTDRLVRLGYNAVRIHHHDDSWWKDEKNRDLFDRLVAACVKKGLYLTTDLHVSRKVKYREIGLDREGDADFVIVKNFMQFYEPAFENWKRFAREFLTRKNPYTGRSLVNEPAMPLIVLLNEPSAHSPKNWAKLREEPLYREQWRLWLMELRKRQPGAYPKEDPERIPEEGNWWNPTERNQAMAAFSSALLKRFALRASTWLRDEIGVKALIATDNNGPILAPIMEMRSSAGTYVDFHGYFDHPTTGAKGSEVKMSLSNENPLTAKKNEIVGAAFHRVWGRPMCMSESNYCGPNEYRSMGGLIRGGLAVAQDWTGVWTFAYAHGKKKALNDRVAPPGRFDLALDPIMQATDRLAILIFLRGDLPTPLAAYANVFDAEAMDPVNVHPLSAAPGWAKCHLEWRARMGAAFGNCVPDGVQAVKALPFMETPPGDPPSIGIAPDYEKGEFTVASERLVAGFRHDGGVIAAGALIAKVGGSPHATVAVASLDGRSIRDSRRLLLWHLTDVLGDGIVFKDESRREILGLGSPNLIVREGFAKAALSVTNPEGLSVFALDSKGRRVRKVNTSVRQGKLIFTMSVDASAPASIYYEVTSGTVREGVMSR